MKKMGDLSEEISLGRIRERLLRARTRRRAREQERAGRAAATALGVELRILHDMLPSGPFCACFDALPRLYSGELRECPRVHLKLVVTASPTSCIDTP
jgi:hypothetical protein